MSFPQLSNNDCCLLTNIDLNPQRINHIFNRRFQSNATTTSFNFKSFHPEEPSSNAKVTRSLLRFHPKPRLTDEDEYNASSESYSSEEEEDLNDELSHADNELSNNDDDDHLDMLAEWEPQNFLPIVESDGEEDCDDDNHNDEINANTSIFECIMQDNDIDTDHDTIQMNCPLGTLTTHSIISKIKRHS